MYSPSNDYDMPGFLWTLVDLVRTVDLRSGIVILPPRSHQTSDGVAVLEVLRPRLGKGALVMVGLDEEFESRSAFREAIRCRLDGAQAELLDPEDES